MRSARTRVSVLLAAVGAALAGDLQAQTTLNGSAMALRSVGGASGTDWTMSANGYLGTYITLASPGTVSFNMQASGVSNPHMNLAVGDSKFGFDVASGFNSYSTSLALPAGTHFVRLEYNNDTPTDASRALTVRNMQIGGATVSNSSTNANALNAADTYVANYRKGTTSVTLTGPAGIPLLAGQSVNVDLSRHAFNFGAAVPGTSTAGVNGYLGTGTTKQAQYQARLKQNFNAVVPENAGKWAYNEATRDSNTMGAVDQILNYAQSNNMRSRMHNLVWGDNSNNGQQPSWVLNSNAAPNNGLLDKAYLGDVTAKNDLRAEVSERIDYYVGTGSASDRAHKFYEIDVYNESYHTGPGAPSSPTDLRHNYWNVYGAQGVAEVYHETIQAVASSGATAKVFVNEYNVLDDGSYANYYVQNLEAIRNAGIAAGLGDVVQGIGAQYYPSTGTHSANKAMANFQNLAVQGLPISLTEFGAQSSLTTAQGATILGEMLRLTFGNAESTGFFMWGFHQESGSGATTLFAPQSALYTVNTADFNNWTLTDAGKIWQDQLGIADWDGNPNDGWSTHLAAIVSEDGTISFNGFYGDYNIAGQNNALLHAKGVGSHAIQLVAPPDWYFWKPANNGNWSTSGNWTTPVAHGVGQTAHFAQATGPRTVILDTNATLGQINFDSSNAYALQGSATLTFDVIAGKAAINVVKGNHTIGTPVTLNDDLRVWVSAADASVTLSQRLIAPTRQLLKQGAGTLNVAGVQLGQLDVVEGTVALTDGSATSVVASLSVASVARLDVGDAIVVVDYSGSTPMADLYADVVSGRAGGTWTGPGITSHLAAASSLYGVAIAEASALPSASAIAGLSIDADAILLRATLLGDVTMDGSVTFDDLLVLAQNYEQAGDKTWVLGDFNFDASVDFDDLLALAQNYEPSVLDAEVGSAAFANDWQLARSLIPEPASLAALCVVSFSARRRR